MGNRGLKQKISNLEGKVKSLEEDLNNDNLSDLDYRNSLREILNDVNTLINESNNLFSLMPQREMKKSLDLVFEAFITSQYADETSDRTDAVLLFKELRLLLN
ncbi:MAG: hypothetical protein CMO82_11290 [Winogradskyella sp.]|nr:hypothetical protein [Winogradskyella sp.]|tara:strand:- start:1621 stop:1929 length:309 start_codon:yes stop_codon:yes gene_type:complete